MNAQQVPQSRQRRVTYLLSYIHVRNPVWIETTVCLYLLYICPPVIHRELQNVVYMKKKSMFKKKGGGSCPQVPVRILSMLKSYLKFTFPTLVSISLQTIDLFTSTTT